MTHYQNNDKKTIKIDVLIIFLQIASECQSISYKHCCCLYDIMIVKEQCQMVLFFH